MNVKIAKNSGFCFGVKRAIRIASEASEKFEQIVTLGPIIHNPQMVEKLEEKGIFSIEESDAIQKRPTIIRSHGIKKEMMEELLQKKIEIIDATCPYVAKAQQYAARLSKDNYVVIILGDESHPEVQALRSYITGENYIVNDKNALPEKRFITAAVISQTTRSIQDLQELVAKLVPLCNELLVINTICSATTIRQNATLKLAKESDIMIVIGGKKSSNTKMLAKICEEFIETHHIETESEICSQWFDNKENIGITAGASTPDWVILEVYNEIVNMLGLSAKMVKHVEEIPGFKEE
jgi:4-hydroxy-3-methylbut-2-enyl diphosphate reductase